jgi:hypothetical protein
MGVPVVSQMIGCEGKETEMGSGEEKGLPGKDDPVCKEYCDGKSWQTATMIMQGGYL